jgi:hypothetical protein
LLSEFNGERSGSRAVPRQTPDDADLGGRTGRATLWQQSAKIRSHGRALGDGTPVLLKRHCSSGSPRDTISIWQLQ